MGNPRLPVYKGDTPFTGREKVTSAAPAGPLATCHNPRCERGEDGGRGKFTPRRRGKRAQIYCHRSCKDNHGSQRLRQKLSESRRGLNMAVLAVIRFLESEGDLRSISYEEKDGVIT